MQPTTLSQFLSNGGLLKMLTIMSFFLLTCLIGYKVLVLGDNDPILNNIFYSILGVMGTSLGFTFGHSNAVSAFIQGGVVQNNTTPQTVVVPTIKPPQSA